MPTFAIERLSHKEAERKAVVATKIETHSFDKPKDQS
jgi:hypothetical protein